jgi:hypothetical protein
MSARSPRRVVVAIALLALAGAGIAIVRGRAAHAPAVSAVEGPPSRTVSRAAAGVQGPARDLEPSFRISPYQSQVARSTLATLDDMESDARRRGDTVLLVRLKSERTRVLRAASRLPTTAPARQERNEP